MSKFITSDPPYNAGLYPTTAGFLQLAGGVALSSTLTHVTDQLNNLSTLELSTNRIRMNTSAAESIATLQITSIPFTSGNGNTNHPVLLFGAHGGSIWAASPNGGTYLGINAVASFPGNFLDFHVDGGASLFKVAASGALTSTAAGAASTPALSLTGTPFVGTGTTSVPLFYLNGGASPTTWNSAANGGTYIGINATSAFAGNFIDFRQNGGASIFSVNVFGGFQTGIGATNTLRGNLQTQNNFTIINKVQVSYLTFMTRNTTGSEVVMDLTNIGTIAASGAISIGNTVAAAIGIASTHKVTVVIGGTTYYLLASNV